MPATVEAIQEGRYLPATVNWLPLLHRKGLYARNASKLCNHPVHRVCTRQINLPGTAPGTVADHHQCCTSWLSSPYKYGTQVKQMPHHQALPELLMSPCLFLFPLLLIHRCCKNTSHHLTVLHRFSRELHLPASLSYRALCQRRWQMQHHAVSGTWNNDNDKHLQAAC